MYTWPSWRKTSTRDTMLGCRMLCASRGGTEGRAKFSDAPPHALLTHPGAGAREASRRAAGPTLRMRTSRRTIVRTCGRLSGSRNRFTATSRPDLRCRHLATTPYVLRSRAARQRGGAAEAARWLSPLANDGQRRVVLHGAGLLPSLNDSLCYLHCSSTRHASCNPGIHTAASACTKRAAK